MTRRLYFPCLDIFMRALPVTFQNIDAPLETVVRVDVTGQAGGCWQIIRLQGGWERLEHTDLPPAATVQLPQEIAWKVFTKRRDVQATLAEFPSIHIEGARHFGEQVLRMVSVMA